MSLSSSLFAGSSGLTTLGDTMQIIGDNIANVNTIGFKSSKATFQDTLSQSLSTMSGAAQVGSGSAIGDVSACFEQGSFETTGNATDLAIGGDGFFVLRESNGEGNFYSRAGNFGFDEEGYMTNPGGYIVQGWRLDETTGTDVGSVTDIHLDSFTSSPKETSQIQLITNLDSTGEDNSQGVDLKDAWDGTEAPPLAEDSYEYQTTIQVYDSLGSTHDITIYFDKTSSDDSSYEYIVTCNPDEDAISSHHPSANATVTDVSDAATVVETAYTAEGTAATAAAAVNTLEATAAGVIATAAAATVDTGDTAVDVAAAAVAARAALNTTGSPEEQAASLAAVVAAETEAARTTSVPPVTIATVAAAATAVETAYTAEGTAATAAAAVNTLEATAAGAIATAAATGADAAAAATAARTLADQYAVNPVDIYSEEEIAAAEAAAVAAETAALVTTDSLATSSGLLTFGVIDFSDSGTIENISMEGSDTPSDEDQQFSFNADFLGGASTNMSISLDFGASYDHTDGEWVNDSLSTTQFAVASNTTYKTSDGYASGELQDISIDGEGIITGTYSNGQTTPLYRVGLANFQNEDGLVKEGGNLFSASLASGDAITSKPGTNGLGGLAAGSLEQSNVDIAEEFVRMITTQRGYQANSKIITTVDTMLGELMNLKR